ncbi:MAG: hypothetical protein AAFU77_17740 [Myxococcota bacterium]
MKRSGAELIVRLGDDLLDGAIKAIAKELAQTELPKNWDRLYAEALVEKLGQTFKSGDTILLPADIEAVFALAGDASPENRETAKRQYTSAITDPGRSFLRTERHRQREALGRSSVEMATPQAGGFNPRARMNVSRAAGARDSTVRGTHGPSRAATKTSSAEFANRVSAKSKWSAAQTKVRAALVRGGLSPDDAQRLARHGLRGSEVAAMIGDDLLTPSLADFPHHALVMALLAEAQAVGGLTAKRLADLVEASQDWVVVRPDGVIASVHTGEALRALEVRKAEDGRWMAGSYEMGRLYFSRSGMQHELMPGFVKNPTVAGEFGLEKGFAGNLLDGAEEVVIGGFVGTAELGAALYLDFNGTLERMRDQLADTIFDLPENLAHLPDALERLANLPRAEQVKLAGKLITSGALMAVGYGQFKGVLAAGSRGGGGLLAGANGAWGSVAALDFTAAALAVGDLSAAGAIAGLGIAGVVPDSGNAVGANGGVGLLEPARDATSLNVESRGLRHADFDELTPQERFFLDDQARRAGLLDPENASHSLAELEDSVVMAKVIGETLPVSLKWFRAKFARRLRREVGKIDELKTEAEQMAHTSRIRAMADDLDIDMHEALRIGGPKVPLSSLSPKAQKIVRGLQRGIEPTGVYTREIAKEVATQFRHYVDTTGWPMWKVKRLLPKRDHQTLHWDDRFGEDGLLLHHGPSNPHATTPHLQLHGDGSSGPATLRVFFES